MVWNSSSAIAIRWRRAAAIRPGSANTSAASRAVSRAVRTAGNAMENAGAPPGPGASKRISGRTAWRSSAVQRRSLPAGVSALTSARA